MQSVLFIGQLLNDILCAVVTRLPRRGLTKCVRRTSYFIVGMNIAIVHALFKFLEFVESKSDNLTGQRVGPHTGKLSHCDTYITMNFNLTEYASRHSVRLKFIIL